MSILNSQNTECLPPHKVTVQQPQLIDTEEEELRTLRRNPPRQRRRTFETCINIPTHVPRSSDFSFDHYIHDSAHHFILTIPYSELSVTSFRRQFNSTLLTVMAEFEFKSKNIVFSLKNRKSVDQKSESSEKQEVHAVEEWSLSGKYAYVGQATTIVQIKTATKKLGLQQFQKIFNKKITDCTSDFFIVLEAIPAFRLSKKYNGLTNKGSTCYMNSFLQALFHLDVFRNLVYKLTEVESNKFPWTLQVLFSKLENCKNKSISTEDLLLSYGWSVEEGCVQQDIQEFCCLFFEVMQRKVDQQPLVKGKFAELFCGELLHYIECVDVDYSSISSEKYLDLQLPVSGNKTLQDSLASYLTPEILEGENMYRTDTFGLQRARKGITIQTLPPILIIQLKRFEYNPFTERNEKVLDELLYPQYIDFGQFTRKKSPAEYQLYGVLVHSGERASSGHYYACLKVRGEWFKFNDSKVIPVSTREVFQDNFGGLEKKLSLDTKQLIVQDTEVKKQTTAYMLIYCLQSEWQYIFKMQSTPPTILQEGVSKEGSDSMQRISQSEKEGGNSQNIQSVPYADLVKVKIVDWSSLEGTPCKSGGIIHQALSLPFTHYIDENIDSQSNIQDVASMMAKDDASVLVFSINQTGSKHKEEHLSSPYRSSKLVSVASFFDKLDDPTLIRFRIDPEQWARHALNTREAYIKNQIMVVIIKKFEVDAHGKASFCFDKLVCYQKQIPIQQIIQDLDSFYKIDAQFEVTYYVQKSQFDLQVLDPNNFLLSTNNKFCSMLLVVEKLPKQQGSDTPAITLKAILDDHQSQILVKYRQEGHHSMQGYYLLSKNATLVELRSIIYSRLDKQRAGCPSPDNIIIKYRRDKSSKRCNQAPTEGRVGDITKADNTVIYTFSKVSLYEKGEKFIQTVKYRFSDSLEMTSEIYVMIDKKTRKQSFQQIVNFPTIKSNLQSQGGKQCRILLIDRAKKRIVRNIDIDEDVTLISKREKGTQVVVQKKRMFQKNIKEGIEVESEEMDAVTGQKNNELLIFVHHQNKDGESIHHPTILTTRKTKKVSELYEQCDKEFRDLSVQFNEKENPFNSSKVVYRLFIETEGAPVTSTCLSSQNNSLLSEIVGDNRELVLEVTHNYIWRIMKTMKLDI